MFTSFESIMDGLVYKKERLHFEPVECRGVFTDGFQLPKAHCNNTWELMQFLKGHKLDVMQPFGSPDSDFLIVKLTDYEHEMSYVSKQIKQATHTMRSINGFLPQPNGGKRLI